MARKQKYHVTPNGIRQCVAQTRKCKYGVHYLDYKEALDKHRENEMERLHRAISSTLTVEKPAIILPLNPLQIASTMPNLVDTGGMKYTYDSIEEEIDYYKDEDYYHEDYYDQGTFYHEGLKISEVGDWKQHLATLFSVTPKEIEEDKELVELAKNLGLNKPEAYTIEDEMGAYRDLQVRITFSTNTKQALTNWYYSKNNAFDKAGILEYVRSKGIDTTGLTPPKALIKQLIDEKEASLQKVLAPISTKAGVYSLPIENILVSNEEKYRKVRAKGLDSKTPHVSEIAGVVTYKPLKGKYVLIDGYSRVKHLEENKTEEANFIILDDISGYGIPSDAVSTIS